VVNGGDTVISIRQRGELCGELSFFFGIRQNTNARTSSASTASFFCLPKVGPGGICPNSVHLFPQTQPNMIGLRPIMPTTALV